MTIAGSVAQSTAPAAGPAAGPSLLGPWVEAHEEACRGGRAYRLLLNHRTQQAIALSEPERAVCAALAAGQVPGDAPGAAAFLEELRELGFLAGGGPSPARRRPLRLSLTRLDVCWADAGRLVRAAHQRGARHLFHPAGVLAQAVLAVAGLVAVAAVLCSRQTFQLRVHPVQVPLVIGLSLAAVGVHELAHALVVVHYRRRVDGVGLRLHLGTPAFYVESASALLLPRRQRLIQAGAGMWAEWQFTSLVALWLCWHPGTFAAGLLHRFVILNAVTIATNLLPFTGLDGAWLLADAVGQPDLAARSRGAVARLVIARAAAKPAGRADLVLVGYSALNGAVAAGLLASAGFLWYQLFGGLVAPLLRLGAAGWLVLAVAAVALAAPAVSAAVGWLPGAARTVGEVRAAVRFRAQWRWRVPASRQIGAALAGPDPAGAAPTSAQLGVIAGQLSRARVRRPLPASLSGPGYGVVRAGAVTALGRDGERVTLTAGATWDPSWRLRSGRRAVVVHLSAAALHQALSAGS